MINSRGSQVRFHLNFFHKYLLPVLLTVFSAASLPLIAQVSRPDDGGQKDEGQKKVLVFHIMRRDDASVLANERVYQQVLTNGLSDQLDYYSEHIDLARFGNSDYQDALRDYLKSKYKGTSFDLIITTADLRNFLAHYGAEVFPNTPVVFSMSEESGESISVPPHFTGIRYPTTRTGTLDEIQRLQPEVKRVFVVTGASQAVDKWHEERVRKQFAAYGNRFEFVYLSGLPMDDLKQRVSSLKSDSVLYFVMLTEDGTGKRFGSTEGLDEIAAVSSVPIYTWHDSYLGHGVVGGRLASSENVARKTAEVALRVLRGERPESIPIARTTTSRLAFDWRELERWKLDESRLPADAEVLFQEPTIWQRYQDRIIGVFVLLVFQSALIVALLMERRRRQIANLDLQKSEERYRNVVENQTEMICRFLPDSTLTFVNETYCQYFQQSADELIGTKFVLLFPESEHEPMLRYIESLVREPHSETREHSVNRPGRKPGWHQWTCTVISPGTGSRVELQGVGRDISERKMLEQQLVRSERHFSTLVEHSPDVICRLNRDLRFIYASPNFAGTFGIAQSYLGKRLDEVADPDYDWNQIESICHEAIDRREPMVHEFQHRGRYYRTRIVPEFSPRGEVESVMTISEDFTQRRRAELELGQLTTRLFTLQDEERRRIARELHDGAAQNIFAITLNLYRAERAAGDAATKVTELIRDSKQLAEQSLTELRTLSYLLHPPVLDQFGLAGALHWFARGFSERSGIRVETAAVQDIGRLPREVETALFRIVQEGLTNVRRHSGSDTADIHLERNNGEVRLQILDQGNGMPEVPRDASADEKTELGVGIPGMRQRLIQLGGRLEIESTSKGTTITAVVPAGHEQALSQHSGR